MPTHPSPSRLRDGATVLLFLAALLAPTLDHLVRPAEARSVMRENRLPAPAPEPVRDLASASRFPLAFEGWFDDRLGLRDVLLRAWQRETALGLGLSPSPTILRGEQGFDFFAGDDSERVHRGARPVSARELDEWTQSLEAQARRCARLGAVYVLVLVPNKETIYPERWPEGKAPVGPTRLDQLAARLAGSDVRFVDLRPALRAEREHDRPEAGDFVFHPLGSHCTWRGAFAAWAAIARALQDVDPPPRVLERSEFAVRELPWNENDSMWDQTYVGDLVRQRGFALEPTGPVQPRIEYGPKNEIVSSAIDDPRLPTALFVHDSFGPWMLPYVVHSFSRLDAVWTHRVPRHQVERLRPRIVVHELTERALTWEFAEAATDIEPLLEHELEAMPLLFGPLDCTRDALFASRGGVALARTEAGWSVDQRAEDGVIELPAAELAEGADLALRILLESPVEGALHLYYQTRSQRSFGRARVFVVNLEAGTNDLRLRTRAQGLFGPVLLRLERKGRYLLRAFEMRAAR